MTTGTEEFESHRRLLFGIAYRMLGSVAEADDIVQEAFLRWQGRGDVVVESPRAWLSTVVTRLCLDELRSARVRREEYVGPWLPEPLRTDDKTVDPESISMAFLVLLEALSPLERAVFLLHKVFDYSYAEIASVVGKTDEACRQLGHRAQQHLDDKKPRFRSTREEHHRLLGGFLQACALGDLDALRGLLAADATACSDGGGRVRAARNVIHGGDAVARFFLGLLKKPGAVVADLQIELADVNGEPAVITRVGGVVANLLFLETGDGLIRNVRLILNPEKLARI